MTVELRTSEIASIRLRSLLLTNSHAADSGAVASWFGALQAQDYQSALWAFGVRISGASVADIESAIADATIVRTWPMRGTLHFVPARDVRWMLNLLSPRVLKAMEKRQSGLELDAKVFAKSAKLFRKALAGGRRLTRSAMFALLDANGIGSAGGRGYHIACRLAQEGLLCFGPHERKEPAFVLLDEWVPRPARLDRDAALSEIARRYFRSHGPATLRDFAWWTGLAMADARGGFEAAAPDFIRMKMPGGDALVLSERLEELSSAAGSHLLPAFDEHLLGYTDRSAVLRAGDASKVVPGSNGMFLPTAVIDGRVAGTWRRQVNARGIAITINAFKPLGQRALKRLEDSAASYGAFVGQDVRIR